MVVTRLQLRLKRIHLAMPISNVQAHQQINFNLNLNPSRNGHLKHSHNLNSSHYQLQQFQCKKHQDSYRKIPPKYSPHNLQHMEAMEILIQVVVTVVLAA
jgi:hypothetical protein